MALEDFKRDLLRLISQHDGGWYWYQLDRALVGMHLDVHSSLLDVIRDLAAQRIIEIRPNPALGEIPRYWLTEAGRSLIEREGLT